MCFVCPRESVSACARLSFMDVVQSLIGRIKTEVRILSGVNELRRVKRNDLANNTSMAGTKQRDNPLACHLEIVACLS